MNEYYTYAYLREDGTPYYIGKGKKGRAYSRHHRSCPTPKDKSRIIFLKKNLTEPDALKHEVYLINVLGRKDLGTGILRNLTDGGEGITNTSRTLSEEHKLKIAKAMTGKRHSKETLAKMSQAQLGNQNNRYFPKKSDTLIKEVA
jgi:hypothetical protein